MKQGLAASFLILFLLASFSHVMMLGMYICSQDFITEQFCVNKEKPELKCKGKCHLADMMVESDEEDTTRQYSSNAPFIIPVFHEQYTLKLPKPCSSLIDCFDPKQHVQSAYASAIFHPPRVV